MSLWKSAAARAVFVLSILVVAAGVCLQLFERALIRQVQDGTEIANLTLTRVFVNDVWDRLRSQLDLASKDPNPRGNPNLRDTDAVVRNFAKGTDLVKVKIYSLSGITLYSSDPAQIGEDKAGNAGFQAAARGRLASELTYRGKFGAFDGELYQRNLVSTYVPVRSAHGVEAVVELYTDRTLSIEAIDRLRVTAYGWAVGIVIVACGLLWPVVRLPRIASGAPGDATARAGQAPEGANDDRTVREAVRALREPSRLPGEAAAAHRSAPPDPLSWERLPGPLRTVSRQLGELALVQELRASTQAPAVPAGQDLPWAAVVSETVAGFSAHRRPAGVSLEHHVESRLNQTAVRQPDALRQMLDLMLDAASEATGTGTVRCNIQSIEKGGVQIEVVGTRSAARSATDAPGEALRDSALEAIDLLAHRMKGRLERASQAASGPWLTVCLRDAG